MSRYTVEQRVEMLKLYYQNVSSIRQTFLALRETYGQHNRPKEDTIRRTVEQFEKTGSVMDHPPPTRRQNLQNKENIELLVETSQFHDVLNKSAVLGLQLGEFWEKTWLYTLTEFS